MPNLKPKRHYLLAGKKSLHQTFGLDVMWFGRCLGIGTVRPYEKYKYGQLTQKCGADCRAMDTNAASVSVHFIVRRHLISKERWQFTKQTDSKVSRVAMNGPYSKGTDVQMYTS